MAEIIGIDGPSLSRAANSLKEGGLVSFPTETVYGLGANALNVESVKKIFEFKGRPLTDPVIVHVLCLEDALKLTSIDDEGREVMKVLAEAFWPGPLTMVVPASTLVPPLVCANSGFVGIRSPSHPVARQLIEKSGVCVAAPSANRFGHVSPTKAAHVMADLSATKLLILDGGDCSVGIESTVCKIEVPDKEVKVLRHGGVSLAAIEALMNEKMPDYSSGAIRRKCSVDDGNMVAPGQLLTHYAPDYPTFLYTKENKKDRHQVSTALVEKCVVVDFNGGLEHLKNKALAYKDVSASGSMEDAARDLFETLRWTESIEGAQAVLLRDISDAQSEMTAAVFDRMYRAASGSRAWDTSNGIALDHSC